MLVRLPTTEPTVWLTIDPGVIATLEAAMETASKDADFVDLVTNKLQFPVSFMGSDALTKDIAATVDGLKLVIEKTK